MKKKIAFVGFWDDFDPDTLPLVRKIREVCELEVVKLCEADYVVYSVFSDEHWDAPEDSIKLFYTGEMLTPDLNACDYAMGFDWMSYGDRYFRLPLYYLYADINEMMESKHHLNAEEVARGKTDFCSITVSNADRNPIFKELFDHLSIYKKVDSGGRWMNNVGGRVNNKLTFDASHKFSIVCENCAQPGYTTEKLVQAFAAGCIPIYWGDPEVTRVFNEKAFIHVQSYASVEEVAEAVRQIDKDEVRYLNMLREPALVSQEYARDAQLEQLGNFLKTIFLTPKEQAYRRNRDYFGRKYIEQRRRQARRSASCLYSTYWINLAKKARTIILPQKKRK